MKSGLRMFVLFAVLLLMGTLVPVLPVSAQDATAQLRVVHASPDAPAVDVYVNGEATLTNVPFFTASDYLELPAGTYQVDIVPAGGALTDAVLSAEATLEAGVAYTAAATNALANLELSIFIDDLSATPADTARVAVYHLSPDAPNVDVKLADGTVLISDLPFLFVETLEVPAGTYDIQVTPAGTDTVVIDLPGTALEAGNVYSVFATDFVANLTPQLAVTSVGAAEAPAPEPTAEAPAPEPTAMPDQPTIPASVRVVHASPDAPAVDVFVNGDAVLTNVPFFTASDYLELPAGTYRVQVAPTGAGADASVIDGDVEVLPGRAYTIAATGFLANIEARIFDDSLAPTSDARVTVYHMSPDAPNVDVKLADGTVLISNLAFNESFTLEVPAGTYDIIVTPAGSDTVVLDLSGTTLESGVFYSVFANNAVASLSAALATVRVSEGTAPAPEATAVPAPAPEPTPVPPVRLPTTATGTSLPMGGLAALGLLLMVAGGAALALRRRS